MSLEIVLVLSKMFEPVLNYLYIISHGQNSAWNTLHYKLPSFLALFLYVLVYKNTVKYGMVYMGSGAPKNRLLRPKMI